MHIYKSLKLVVLVLFIATVLFFAGCGGVITPNTYTITSSAGPNGSISPSGDVTVNQGSDKSFTITPDTGYSIDDVLVDGSSVGAVSSYTFTNVTEDHTISATFSAAATGPVHNLTKDTYYNTIQEALDDADSLGGDNIEVDDGTYNESITFPANKVVTLQSASGIRDNVIIQGANNFATVTTNVSSTGTTLRGFTITHTGENTGRGIYIGSGNLIVDNCTISGNTSDDSGGGINNYGTLTITSSNISGNTAANNKGGGIYSTVTLTITESTISDNTADDGGGICNRYGTLTITESIISGNTSDRHGGGIHNDHYGTLTIASSTISDNTAVDVGGGIGNVSGTLTITSSTISDNTADDGGGICNYGSLTITGGTVSNNSANQCGGGIYNCYDGTLAITSSNISGNNVSQQGGGIYLEGTGTITIGGESPADKNTICGNYKDGYSPSLDQQVSNSDGSLYDTYKGTNYISVYCD